MTMANNTKKMRKELALFLKKNTPYITKEWSSQIFKVLGHRRLKQMISARTHSRGMRKFLGALVSDIERPTKHRCAAVLERLVLKDYLSANTAEDTTHGLLILRSIMEGLLNRAYRHDGKMLNSIKDILNLEIDKNVRHLCKVFRKRDFGRLESLMKYGKKLISIHDIDKLCRMILEAAMQESNPDRASLMLVDKDGYLYIKASKSIPRKIIANTVQRVGTGIAGRVAKTGIPIIINEGQKIEPSTKRYMRGLSLASAVSIPIIAHGRVIGVLNLGKHQNKPFFDDEDVELLMILAYEAGAAISNCRLIEELQDYYIGSIVSLASALDTRDHYTQGHSERVGRYSTAIGKQLKLSHEQISNIRCASMLHDIGKIGIPDRILLKPGKLTEREFTVIKKHPVFAVKILRHIPRLKKIIPIVYHEHERYDGKGYVEGLKGRDIPIEARIISVADAYEAMTSDRPYRKALPMKVAIKELKKCAGTQFDPDVVKVFASILKRS
ncbi:MAG: GAF domain-containing protein [Candidatus Omnitrophica bacterium]|nr:GAF domain-containing protein [Candidatus Omnitrophota bacterium]